MQVEIDAIGLGITDAVDDQPRAHPLGVGQRLLAHELKTPLTSMRSLTQLLGGFELNEGERRRVASLLEAEAGKLQLLVHELLELERLPLRDFADSATTIDLTALVTSRVEFLRASADRPLLLDAQPQVYTRGDAALLERVLDNLAGNALKYAPHGMPVTIRLRAENNDAVLEVEDRGRALDDRERARIFDRFVRGSTAAGTQGLGLGLSLVAEVARWHRGTVVLSRASDGGTLFRVTLPAAAAPLPLASAAHTGGL